MEHSVPTRPQSAAKYFLLALLIIAFDQLSKWAVHRYMFAAGVNEVPIFGQWAKLHYTTNPGMAFGVELPAPYGKILLTVFRLLAVGGIGYYLTKLAQQRAAAGFMASIALIMGGAVGNLIDSIFYGVVYGSELTVPGAPTPWFHGKVIDMLYVPLYEGILPQWLPFVGGEYSSGFPIFNLADSFIFIGVVLILLNQKRFFQQPAEAPAAPVTAGGGGEERAGSNV